MWPSHGSNPQYLFKAAGKRMPDHFIDFSANINPLGPPDSLKGKWDTIFKKISEYPDPFASELKKQIAIKEGITESNILIGNGGAELISLVGRMLYGKRVVIIQPTFSEYEQVCKVNECEISHYYLEEGWDLQIDEIKHKLKETDAVFLCNPTNPTGVYYGKEAILLLLKECHESGCLVIIDEAFYDFLDNYESIVSSIKEFSNLIIIRSMTKMFAIPSLRLGYLITNAPLIKLISRFQNHWSINGIAQFAGEICLHNEKYIEKTKQLIFMERNKLFDFYRKYEFVFSESKVNFYLLRDSRVDNQLSFFYFLLEKGIVARHTFNFPSLEGKWLRFAVKNVMENDRLMEVLKEWRHKHP